MAAVMSGCDRVGNPATKRRLPLAWSSVVLDGGYVDGRGAGAGRNAYANAAAVMVKTAREWAWYADWLCLCILAGRWVAVAAAAVATEGDCALVETGRDCRALASG